IFLSEESEDSAILNTWKSESEKRISQNEQTGLKVFGAGLRYLRAKADKTLADLAKETGLTLSVYHRIEMGQREIYKDEFSLICKALSIPEKSIVETVRQLSQSGELDKYIKANETSFKVFNSIDMLNRTAGSDGTYKIPLYGRPAGNGNIIINKGEADLVNCPNHQPTYHWENMYALRLCTRRLGSTLPSKAILYIDTTQSVSVGDIAIMKTTTKDGSIEAQVMSIKEELDGKLYGILKNPTEKIKLDNAEMKNLEKVVFISLE
ncbi:MAG: helix-turn-helix domain-containing protein, partial [Rickettsiales bacterium]|nr:helix-turn-helix domain-containing protein [Rickettsiales bacterium]